jgi:hypothetical protein
LAAPSTDSAGVTALADARPAPLEAMRCATVIKASALAREGYETSPAGH